MTTESTSQLDYHFTTLCIAPSDINEHLPLLRHLASECEHVTEMGMRTGVSTGALLAGLQPTEPSPKKLKTLVSWDINPIAVISQRVADLVSMSFGRVNFQPRVGNTLEINIEPTDMLFIDTLHTAKQLRDELFRHCVYGTQDPQPPHDQRFLKSVRKYLVFHDTETYGMRGEDGSEPGLRAAISLFQKHTFPLWSVMEDRKNNNGLVVLRREHL